MKRIDFPRHVLRRAEVAADIAYDTEGEAAAEVAYDAVLERWARDQHNPPTKEVAP